MRPTAPSTWPGPWAPRLTAMAVVDRETLHQLLSVKILVDAEMDEFEKELQDSARRHLARVRDRALDRRLAIEEVLATGNVEEIVPRTIQERSVDLIALGGYDSSRVLSDLLARAAPADRRPGRLSGVARQVAAALLPGPGRSYNRSCTLHTRDPAMRKRCLPACCRRCPGRRAGFCRAGPGAGPEARPRLLPRARTSTAAGACSCTPASTAPRRGRCPSTPQRSATARASASTCRRGRPCASGRRRRACRSSSGRW